MQLRTPGLRRFLALLACMWTLCAAAPQVFAATALNQEEVYGVPRHVTTTVGDAFGDDSDAPAEMRLLVQARWGITQPMSSRTGERTIAQEPDGWVLNRAMWRVSARPIPQVSAKVLLDFASLRTGDTVQTVKLAYTQVELHSRVQLVAGLFKRPFSLLELLPIGEHEFGDNGRTDGLIKDTGVAGRDLGVMLQVSPLPRKKLLKVSIAAFQGGHAGQTARVDGLWAMRVESTPWKHLHLGADLAWRRRAADHDLDTADGPQSEGLAWSADAMLDWKRWDVRAEVLGGDRTDLENRVNTRFDTPALTYLGAWALALYRIPVRKSVLMPGVRVEWLDADREHPVGAHLAVSAVANIDFDPRLRLLIDVTRQWVEDGSAPLGKKPAGDVVGGVNVPYADVDFTRLVVQVQVRL